MGMVFGDLISVMVVYMQPLGMGLFRKVPEDRTQELRQKSE